MTRSTAEPIAPEKLAIDSFVTMRARYLLDTEDWTSDVIDWSSPTARHPDAQVLNAYIDGYVAFKRCGDARPALERLSAARMDLDQQLVVDPPADGTARSARAWAQVLELELLALVRAADGDGGRSIAELQQAAKIEDNIPYEFGPPFIDKPAYELLGEVLLAAGKPAEARVAFEKGLKRTPNRTASLLGLMQAAERSGDDRTATEIKTQLRAIWARADRMPSTLQ